MGFPLQVFIGGVGANSRTGGYYRYRYGRAKVTRVCAYDRAGYAWSDMSPGFERFSAIAADMRELLRKAGINPPWILAGHALGALKQRSTTGQFQHPGSEVIFATNSRQPGRERPGQ